MSRHHGTNRHDAVVVNRCKASTQVLGPGDRAVFWVAGCELRCRGCIAPETHPAAGREVPVRDLGGWVVRHARDGLTISGGEPMLQARAIARVIDEVREARPGLHVMLYSGYRLEWLRSKGSVNQRRLLRHVDLLVDGPYIERLHAPVRWRGSRNQRLIDLSGQTPELGDPDHSAGIELDITDDLIVELTGVPPAPGFRRWLEETA